MRLSRSHRIVATLGAVVAVSTWVVGVTYLDWGRSSAKDVRLVDPEPVSRFEAEAGTNLWLRAEGARDCERRGAGVGRIWPDGDLDLRVPLSSTEFGDRLVWVGFDCSDGSTRFARAGKVSRPDLPNAGEVEVVRVGMDFHRAEDWLSEALTGLVHGIASEKMGGEQYVGTPSVTLDVSDGFAVVIEMQVHLNKEAKSGWATAKWELHVVAVETGDRDQPIELVFKTRDFDLDPDNAVVNFLLWLTPLESYVGNALKEGAEADANTWIKKTMHWFRENTSERLLSFLINDSATVRRIVASGALPGKLKLDYVDVGRDGETLHFSLLASRRWLGTAAPTLAATDTGESVSVSVSYVFINRLLNLVLGGREMKDVLKELRSMLVLSGAVDSGAFDQAERDVAGIASLFGGFFDSAELRYDDSLSFELPVRLRPASAGETRVFFNNARVLTIDPAPTYGDWRDAPPPSAAEQAMREELEGVGIGLSAEGRVILDRIPNERDVSFLLDHIAFEPLATDGRLNDARLARYYGLTPLLRQLVRWERDGDLEDDRLGAGLRKFRSDMLSVIRAASMREHAPIEFELYKDDQGVAVGSVDLARNDLRSNALVLEGTIGYSKAGAIAVTEDQTEGNPKLDQKNAQEAINAARTLCQAQTGKRCIAKLVFYRAVVAAAVSDDGKIYLGKGASENDARALAIDRCRRAGALRCRVYRENIWRNSAGERSEASWGENRYGISPHL